MSSSNGRIEADIIRQIRSQVKKKENKLIIMENGAIIQDGEVGEDEDENRGPCLITPPGHVDAYGVSDGNRAWIIMREKRRAPTGKCNTKEETGIL
ncbi:hypothetical protein PV327_010800 [Microctonus hyperodae]|uniref:Uncharacterized protein n=1 Tax=Microctonus hyperodae TaxID=165561 RepID=A0AA39C885_MICHY|nr:hypothetical protein PV327_010800 [Microctonus hyperodae]